MSMYKSEVKGKGCIIARIVADSISEHGKRITTFECEYPRFIHGELMTHRMFSRNAASSRAIPVSKMIDQVRNNPAMPIHWGANEKGMQATSEIEDVTEAIFEWEISATQSAEIAGYLDDIGVHKQVTNRILEPYQIMKTIITATEWNNFFALRNHPDAQPEIQELARCMQEAMSAIKPELLKAGEWHLPYVNTPMNLSLGQMYMIPFENDQWELSLEEAIKVSASCCAQVSYRVLDQGLKKALIIYDDLVNSKPVHASPFEHQATPMRIQQADHGDWSQGMKGDAYKGITHEDEECCLWSGNFQGWIQNRQLIKDNYVEG